MRFSVDFDSFLNEKWLIFRYMYNNDIMGHAILKKCAISCVLVYMLIRLGFF